MTTRNSEPPNHPLQRTRPSRRGCNATLSWAGSLSLGRWPLDHPMNPKRLIPLLVALTLVLASSSGCATRALLAEAKPHQKLNPETKRMEEVPGSKSAYAGVPFAVVWDVATSPLVGLGLLFVWASGYRG